MKGYIYSLEKKDGIFYIGCSTEPEHRAKQHKTQSRYFDEITNCFVNYDSFDFKMEIIEEVEYKFKEELLEVEAYWIYQFKAWGFNLKNVNYRKVMGYSKVPNDILSLFKIHAPHINPYRTVETDAFIKSLYKIIRNLKEQNDNRLLRQ